jgi:tetratricopeptide (TPR) repeat protein
MRARAIDAYANIVDLDDHNVPALEALAKLYDKTGDAAQSIDYMTRVAELTQDTKQRVEAFYRIGKALDEKLGDRVFLRKSASRWRSISTVASADARRAAADRRSTRQTTTRRRATSPQEQSYTQSPRQRARLLVELGKLREEMLGDHASAVLAWEEAHEADPENEDAAMPLVDEYIATEMWGKAEPLLDLLVRKSNKRERSEQHDLQNKLGRVCAALGKDDKALKAYTAAHQLDLTDQVTIRGLAEVSLPPEGLGGGAHELPEGAHRPRRGRVGGSRGRLLQARLHQAQSRGRPSRRSTTSRRPSSVDPAHRPRSRRSSLYTEAKDWKQVVAYKRQILDNVYDPRSASGC